MMRKKMSECAFGDVERLKSGGPAMTVVGRVESRSSSTSRRDCGPPGESEIYRLNPQREGKITRLPPADVRRRPYRWRVSFGPAWKYLLAQGEPLGVSTART